MSKEEKLVKLAFHMHNRVFKKFNSFVRMQTCLTLLQYVCSVRNFLTNIYAIEIYL